jgi:hypothetical protein
MALGSKPQAEDFGYFQFLVLYKTQFRVKIALNARIFTAKELLQCVQNLVHLKRN